MRQWIRNTTTNREETGMSRTITALNWSSVYGPDRKAVPSTFSLRRNGWDWLVIGHRGEWKLSGTHTDGRTHTSSHASARDAKQHPAYVMHPAELMAWKSANVLVDGNWTREYRAEWDDLKFVMQFQSGGGLSFTFLDAKTGHASAPVPIQNTREGRERASRVLTEVYGSPRPAGSSEAVSEPSAASRVRDALRAAGVTADDTQAARVAVLLGL